MENSSLGGVSQFIVDEATGKITGYKTEIGGADTVFPFNNVQDIINLPTAIIMGVAYVGAIAEIKNNNKTTAVNYNDNITISSEGFTCYRSSSSNCYINATKAGTYFLIKNNSISIKTITSSANLLTQTPHAGTGSIGVMIAIRLF